MTQRFDRLSPAFGVEAHGLDVARIQMRTERKVAIDDLGKVVPTQIVKRFR